jgi:hypothetical protein
MRTIIILGAVAALAAAQVPDCKLAPGWTQAGPAREFEGESLYEYMNGNSEGYLIYGFKKMHGVTCKKGEDTIHIDISDMADPEAAYGIFCANRDIRVPTERLGMGGQVGSRKVTIAKGQYYLEIAAEPEKDHTGSLRELAVALEKQVTGRTDPPEQISWFVASQLQPGWPRLVPQSVLGVRLLKRGYVAQYENGSKAFVVPESSDEAATATMAKLRDRLADVAPLPGVEGGYTGVDKYLGRMVVVRSGRYIAGYSGLKDDQDGAALAKELSAKVHN